MNSKVTVGSQLSTTEPKKKPPKTKQTTRTGRESQKWRPHGGLSVGEWEGKRGGKDTGNKQHKWQVENRQGEGKNSVGNEEAKELTCMTHGHELKWKNAGGSRGTGQRGITGEKWDNCNSTINKIYLKKRKKKNQPMNA